MRFQAGKRASVRLLARLTSEEPVGCREFFWLCLPALLIGLFLRLHFLLVTPQGYFGADSVSYYEFSHELFTKGQFELTPKRRWLYPIVLALLTPLPAPCWYLVPLIQHALGLATVVGIGWITLRLDLLRPLGMQPGKKGLESFSLRPFGLLLVLGVLRSLRPGLNRRAALLLLPTGVYLFAVFAVGDAVGRYLHPVEWVAFVLAVLAIEALVRLFLQAIRTVSRSL